MAVATLASVSTGWRQIRRKSAATGAQGPDSAVAAPSPIWMAAVVAACTTALLGTSDVSPPVDSTPTSQVTHLFSRTGIEGGSVELSAGQPRATFSVTIVADELGPKNVMTTSTAVAHLHGSVTSSDLPKNAAPPSILVDASSPETMMGSSEQATNELTQDQQLQFIGDCANPKSGSCRAHFQLELSRSDDGTDGGTVTVAWTFDVESAGIEPSSMTGEVSAVDPPWTITVTPP